MNGWMILGIIVLILFLLCQIRIGGQAEYSDKGFEAWIRIASFKIQVFPLKKKDKAAKKKKPPKEKKKKKKAETAESESKSITEKVGGALDYAQNLLPIGLDAVKHLYSKIQMDKLELELIVGSADPADAAMAYGQASAALGALWYPLTQAFHVKDGNARVRVDFEAKSMTVYGLAALTIKIGQILWLGIYFGVKALRAFLAVRKRQKTKQSGKAV